MPSVLAISSTGLCLLSSEGGRNGFMVEVLPLCVHVNVVREVEVGKTRRAPLARIWRSRKIVTATTAPFQMVSLVFHLWPIFDVHMLSLPRRSVLSSLGLGVSVVSMPIAVHGCEDVVDER